MVVPPAPLPAAELVPAPVLRGRFPHVAARAKQAPGVFAAELHGRRHRESVLIARNDRQVREGLSRGGIGVVAPAGRPHLPPRIDLHDARERVGRGFRARRQPIAPALLQLAGGALLFGQPRGIGRRVVEIHAHHRLAGLPQGETAKIAAVVRGIHQAILLVGHLVAADPHPQGGHPDEFHLRGLRHPRLALDRLRRGRHQRLRRRGRRPLHRLRLLRRRPRGRRLRRARGRRRVEPRHQRAPPEPKAADQRRQKDQDPRDQANAPPFCRAATAAAAHARTAQGFHEIRAGHESVPGLLRQGALQRRARGGRQFRRQGPVLFRSLSGQQLPRQHGQRILVAGRIRFLALLQFGRQIRPRRARAHGLAMDDRQMVVRRQSKIRHPHHLVRTEENVRRFQIAMDDPLPVREIERLRHLPQHGQRLVERALAVRPHLGPCPDVHSGREIPHQIDLVAHVHDLADGRQIRMGLVRNPPDPRMDHRHDRL